MGGRPASKKKQFSASVGRANEINSNTDRDSCCAYFAVWLTRGPSVDQKERRAPQNAVNSWRETPLTAPTDVEC